MKRGDIRTVRGKLGATTKARPCVIVQRSSTLADTTKVTACPITSSLGQDNLLRPGIAPTAANGLRKASQIEVDWVFTDHVDRFGETIGVVDEITMRAVDRALKLWLEL